jgi:hypothetical protein
LPTAKILSLQDTPRARTKCQPLGSKKIKELTLYLIAMNQALQAAQAKIEALEAA